MINSSIKELLLCSPSSIACVVFMAARSKLKQKVAATRNAKER